MANLIISDRHFNHENIIKYENRPFKNKDEMNDFMIREHNKVVTKRDNVFDLGDLAWGNKQEVKDIISQLNGNIHLILGNHDREHSDDWWLDAGVKRVYRYPIIYRDFFILSHEPAYLSVSMPYVNFHGHSHSNCYSNPQYVNCSVEIFNYIPQDLDKLINRFKGV